MKIYVTFGQIHRHEINGTVFDKDTVAVIECLSDHHGREIAFGVFGERFCFTFPESGWDEENMSCFPKGYVEVPREAYDG